MYCDHLFRMTHNVAHLLASLPQHMALLPGVQDMTVSTVVPTKAAILLQDFKSADPRKRMRRFFDTLYSSLNRGARAVLQIYPENAVQAQSLTTAAMRAGFSGGLVVDFPHSTRAKKYFLVLMVGGMTAAPQPKGLSGEASDEEEAHVSVAGRAHVRKKQRTGGHSLVSSALGPYLLQRIGPRCFLW